MDKHVALSYRDGGLFPEEKKAEELRARTALAYGFDKGYLNPQIFKNPKVNEQVVLLCRGEAVVSQDEQIWMIAKPINTGIIYISGENAGWSDQPCRLFLHLTQDVNVDGVLRFYFQTSMRWLNDRPSSRGLLDQLFSKVM